MLDPNRVTVTVISSAPGSIKTRGKEEKHKTPESKNSIITKGKA